MKKIIKSRIKFMKKKNRKVLKSGADKEKL